MFLTIFLAVFLAAFWAVSLATMSDAESTMLLKVFLYPLVCCAPWYRAERAATKLAKERYQLTQKLAQERSQLTKKLYTEKRYAFEVCADSSCGLPRDFRHRHKKVRHMLVP